MEYDVALVIGFIAILAIAALVWYALHSHRKQALRRKFGPEYEHAVKSYKDESTALNALEKRAERTKKYALRPLSERERQDFAASWRTVQGRFVDDPRGAVRDSDKLVCRLMETRGYPMADFDRRVEDLSVDHGQVVQNYRVAHKIALADADGKATTEDLRRAVVCYRALFAELLETQPATPTGREVHA